MKICLALAEPEFHREARQRLAARIASARANELLIQEIQQSWSLTRKSTKHHLYSNSGPTIIYPDLIIPRACGVRLHRRHSINAHEAVIVISALSSGTPSKRSFLNQYTWQRTYDDQLLIAIRSDTKVLLVTCSVRDDNTVVCVA
jgi:hypothetical protein